MKIAFIILSACAFFPLFIKAQERKIPPQYLEAESLYRQKKDSLAFPIFRSLLKTAEDDSVRIEIIFHLAYMLSDEGKIDSSLDYFKEVISISEEKKMYFPLAKAYNGIGNQFLLRKNYREALSYFSDALHNSKSGADSARSYVSILVTYLKQKKYESAYAVTKKIIAGGKEDAVLYQSIYTDQAQGSYFLSKGMNDSALLFFRSALSRINKQLLKSHSSAHNLFYFKANIYNDIAEGFIAKKDYSTAFLYQDSAAVLNNKLRNGEDMLPFYDTYAKLYTITGNYKMALLFSDSARHLSDSLFDVYTGNARIDADAKYNNQKVLADKAIVEKQSSITQRNLIAALFGLGFIALIAFVSLRISRVRKKANYKLSAQKEEVQKLADELSVANEAKARLFSTIGHDLRSPVSSLYALLKMQEIKGGEQSSEMSGHTIQLLDTLEDLLAWSKSQMEGFVLQPVKINMQELLEELRQFYNAAAQAKQVSLVSNAQQIAVRTDENILKVILRNAVSNAIAHTAPAGRIIFNTAYSNTGAAVISVWNPCSKDEFDKFKAGLESAAIKSNAHGFGIVLMKEFAQKIGASLLLSYEGDHAVLNIII